GAVPLVEESPLGSVASGGDDVALCVEDDDGDPDFRVLATVVVDAYTDVGAGLAQRRSLHRSAHVPENVADDHLPVLHVDVLGPVLGVPVVLLGRDLSRRRRGEDGRQTHRRKDPTSSHSHLLNRSKNARPPTPDAPAWSLSECSSRKGD